MAWANTWGAAAANYAAQQQALGFPNLHAPPPVAAVTYDTSQQAQQWVNLAANQQQWTQSSQQQWQQWQQQYQEWQLQYGEQYQKAMNASGMAPQGAPPLPPPQSTNPAPPPPPDEKDKPPPPPSDNFQGNRGGWNRGGRGGRGGIGRGQNYQPTGNQGNFNQNQGNIGANSGATQTYSPGNQNFGRGQTGNQNFGSGQSGSFGGPSESSPGNFGGNQSGMQGNFGNDNSGMMGNNFRGGRGGNRGGNNQSNFGRDQDLNQGNFGGLQDNQGGYSGGNQPGGTQSGNWNRGGSNQGNRGGNRNNDNFQSQYDSSGDFSSGTFNKRSQDDNFGGNDDSKRVRQDNYGYGQQDNNYNNDRGRGRGNNRGGRGRGNNFQKQDFGRNNYQSDNYYQQDQQQGSDNCDSFQSDEAFGNMPFGDKNLGNYPQQRGQQFQQQQESGAQFSSHNQDNFRGKDDFSKPPPAKDNFSEPPPAIVKASQVPSNQSQPPKKDTSELSEAEKTFDAQFKQWEQQFNTWKDQNKNHPDKNQYREYEAKWESWREQLLSRREGMRKKREAGGDPQKSNDSFESPLLGNKGPNTDKPVEKFSNQPGNRWKQDQGPQSSQKPGAFDKLEGAAMGNKMKAPDNGDRGFGSKWDKPAEPVKQGIKAVDLTLITLDDDFTSLLKKATEGGIPGLDLVTSDKSDKLPDNKIPTVFEPPKTIVTPETEKPFQHANKKSNAPWQMDKNYFNDVPVDEDSFATSTFNQPPGQGFRGAQNQWNQPPPQLQKGKNETKKIPGLLDIEVPNMQKPAMLAQMKEAESQNKEAQEEKFEMKDQYADYDDQMDQERNESYPYYEEYDTGYDKYGNPLAQDYEGMEEYSDYQAADMGGGYEKQPPPLFPGLNKDRNNSGGEFEGGSFNTRGVGASQRGNPSGRGNQRGRGTGDRGSQHGRGKHNTQGGRGYQAGRATGRGLDRNNQAGRGFDRDGNIGGAFERDQPGRGFQGNMDSHAEMGFHEEGDNQSGRGFNRDNQRGRGFQNDRGRNNQGRGNGRDIQGARFDDNYQLGMENQEFESARGSRGRGRMGKPISNRGRGSQRGRGGREKDYQSVGDYGNMDQYEDAYEQQNLSDQFNYYPDEDQYYDEPYGSQGGKGAQVRAMGGAREDVPRGRGAGQRGRGRMGQSFAENDYNDYAPGEVGGYPQRDYPGKKKEIAGRGRGGAGGRQDDREWFGSWNQSLETPEDEWSSSPAEPHARMLPERMLPERMQPERMLPERRQPERMLPERMQPERMLPERMQPERMLPERMLPEKTENKYAPAAAPGAGTGDWNIEDDEIFSQRRPIGSVATPWDDFEDFKPVTVVDYGHEPKAVVITEAVDPVLPAPVSIPALVTPETDKFQEPLQTFDYGHGEAGSVVRNTDRDQDVWNRPMMRDQWDEEDEWRRYRDNEWDRGDRFRHAWQEDRGRERSMRGWGNEDRYRREGGRRDDNDRLRRDDADRGGKKESSKSSSRKSSNCNNPPPAKKPEAPAPPSLETEVSTTPVDDLLCLPGRVARPPRIAFFMRGLPGSGKSFVAKLIKDKELENGGHAPRILCLDDYFMVETEKESKDPETGKTVKKKEMVYEYEAEMESHYRTSLSRGFKKTVDDGYFPFIILDCVNEKLSYFEELWNYAKLKGFQTYIVDMEVDIALCAKRNEHNRTLKDIEAIMKDWEPTPSSFARVDLRSLLQSASINEVEMEELSDGEFDAADETGANNASGEDDSGDAAATNLPTSKWETMEHTGDKLDRLDGLMKRRPHATETIEDWLQLPDDYNSRPAEPGKKRVSWADLEERKQQERMRAIGFVVGQTDWSRMTDPTFGEGALTQTKYI